MSWFMPEWRLPQDANPRPDIAELYIAIPESGTIKAKIHKPDGTPAS
jgi:hypothetical protein